MHSFSTFALCIAASLFNQGNQATAQAGRNLGQRAQLSYLLESGVGLQAYSWDGAAEVPVSPNASRGGVSLPFGELGISADTRFYLPIHESIDASASGQLAYAGQAVGTVVAQGVEWAEGRYRGALQFPKTSASVRFITKQGPVLGKTWRLDFWLWLPEKLQPATILKAPGAFEFVVSHDGHCRVLVEDEPAFRLKSRTPILAGAWNHVGLTLDGPELQQIRFSFNGSPSGKFVSKPLTSEALTIGGFVGAIDDFSLREYPATSSDYIKRWSLQPDPGSHSLRLRYKDRVDVVSIWADALEQPRLEAQDLGRGDLWHTLPSGAALTWVPGQWKRYETNHAPLPRTTHPTVYVGDHRVFLFGGETRDSHVGGMVNTDDTWIFHTDTGQWFRSQSELSPPPNCHQSAAYSPDHDVVLYAGGQFNEREEYRISDETWLYHVAEDRWEQMQPEGDEIGPMSDGATIYDPRLKKFVQFAGGLRAFTYDPSANRWERLVDTQAVSEKGDPTRYVPGGSPMAAYHPSTGKVVLFGGANGSSKDGKWQNSTAFFSVTKSLFEVIETPSAPPPRVRGGYAFDSIRNRFVLFGGVKDQMSVRNGDLWTFLPKERRWIEMESNQVPSARGGFYHMAFDPELDRFIVLCGRLEPRRFENEAWSLHLDETTIGTATYVFDRRGFPAFDHWFAQWEEPKGSRVSFRFRSSSDSYVFGSWKDNAAEAVDANAAFVMVEVSLSAGSLDSRPSLLRMGFQEQPLAAAPTTGEQRQSSSRVTALAH